MDKKNNWINRILGGGNTFPRNITKRGIALGLAVIIGCSSMTSYAAVRDNIRTGFDSYENMIIETDNIAEDGDYALIGIPKNGLYDTNSQLKVPVNTLVKNVTVLNTEILWSGTVYSPKCTCTTSSSGHVSTITKNIIYTGADYKQLTKDNFSVQIQKTYNTGHSGGTLTSIDIAYNNSNGEIIVTINGIVGHQYPTDGQAQSQYGATFSIYKFVNA